MKTIKERAEEVGIICRYKSDYRYDRKSVEYGYLQGATEQKKIDINKACEWLKENLQCGVHPCSSYGFVDMFRKVMEE